MQVTISSLDILVKNLSENDFKFLSPKFFGEKLELVKRFLCIQVHRLFLKVWRRVDKFIDNFERYAY